MESVFIANVSVLPLLEKPTAEVKVRALAFEGDAFVRSIERAEGLALPANTEDGYGYPAFDGPLVGIRREVRGPLYLGPEKGLREGRAVTTEALCAAIPAPQRPDACPDVLRRVVFPSGATLGFRTCLAGPCPIVFAAAGGSAPKYRVVEGLVQLRGLSTEVAGQRGFRLVLERSIARPGQGPGAVYELADVDADGKLTTVLSVEGSTTTIDRTSGELTARLVNVRFGPSSVRVVGTRRVAPDVASAGVVVPVDETIPVPR